MDTNSKSKNIETKILKCGKRTYFFDVKEASNGNKYLRVTESQFVKEGEKYKKNSILLFKEDVQPFLTMMQEISLEA